MLLVLNCTFRRSGRVAPPVPAWGIMSETVFGGRVE